MFRDEGFVGVKATVLHVEVQDEQSGARPRRDADVSLRPTTPPLPDCRFVSGGVVDTVRRQRMFPG